MRCCIDAVWSEVYFEHIVVLDVVVFGGGMSDESVGFGGQHDDSVVRVSDSDFIFGAYHAERFHASYLRFFNLEFISVLVVEGCADSSHDHSLSGCYIRSAADNLHGALPELYGGDVEMVAIGVFHACEHLAYDDSGEAAADGFYGFNASGLEADRGQGRAEFFWCQIEVDVFLEPFI